MAGGFDVKLIGGKELRRKLARLPQTVQNRVMGPSVNFAMTPMNAAAKRNVPVMTGLLKQSLGKKVKQYKHSGVTWGAVGPRKGYKVAVTGGAGSAAVVQVGKIRSVITESRDPVNYAHLVELGTHGKPGSRFLTRAHEATKTQQMRRLADKIHKGIEREAKRK